MSETTQRSSFEVSTRGRGTYDVTEAVQAAVANAGVDDGLCTVFIHHTSASLIITENADVTVRSDLERFFAKLVRDGDPMFEHTAEGPDDMPSHVRSAVTCTSLGIPIAGGRCDLGTWQGIFLWEHRKSPHRRRITVCVTG